MVPVDGSRAQTLSDLLNRAAREWGGRVAIEEESGKAITYWDLARLANVVRRRLEAAGVRRGDRVGIHVPKSIDAVAAIHGVLAAGAAYVPVDPEGPVGRAAYILADCGVRIALVEHDRQQALRQELNRLGANTELWTVREVGSGSGLLADAGESRAGNNDESGNVASDDLAYILYTSGSTGLPKGVMLSHRNALSFLEWCEAEFRPTPEDRFSSHAPFHFDLSILDLFVPVMTGATVVLVGTSTGKAPLALAAFIAERRISVWYSAPSALALVTQYGRMHSHDYSALRLVLFAGEVFPVKHLRTLRCQLAGRPFYNLYGPTETNVCTAYRIPDEIPDERTEPYPIGAILSHLQGRIVDETGEPVPHGTEGELCIAGAGVMRGYWNRAAQTEASFLTDTTGTMWYRTGDIVVERDGVLSFVGRRDRMVKRRGHRIELGEIEAALYQHEAVQEAAVVATTDEDRGTVITAFLACANDPLPSTLELKGFCSKVLPLSMMPDRFVVTQNLPRTSTDKIDYQHLTALL